MDELGTDTFEDAVEEDENEEGENEEVELPATAETVETVRVNNLEEAVVNDKSSDDGDETAWDTLMSEMGDDVVVNLDYLAQHKIRAKVPVAYCMNI
jgi:hypothetical protein